MKRLGEGRQKYDAHIETRLLAISNPAESEVREQARSYEEPKHSASVAASSLASRTTRESSIREQTRAYEKPKLGARMSRAESEA